MENQDYQVLEVIQQPTRITGVTIERLYNLGNYENIKYGVRVEIRDGDDPRRVVAHLERIFDNLRAKSGVSSYELERAKESLAKPESELNSLDRENRETYQNRIRRHEQAQARRKWAREALSILEFTDERKDHKQDWDDDDRYDYEYEY
jgi:hypothetical protein